MNRVRRRVRVQGRVQGVFFRESTRRRAVELGAAGWVRNRVDGSVEAVFEGSPDVVAELLAFVRAGPGASVVLHVEVVDEPPERLSVFEIR